MWKCCLLLQGFKNILSECSFCITSIFILSKILWGTNQEWDFFGSACFFFLLKYNFIHRLLSPCWYFHFCGSKQTLFRGGGTLSPVSAAEAVTHFVIFLFNLANIKIRFCCSGTFLKSPLAGFHPEYLQLNKIHGMKESIQSWKGEFIVWDIKHIVCLQRGSWSWSRDRHGNGGTRSGAPSGLEKGHRKEEAQLELRGVAGHSWRWAVPMGKQKEGNWAAQLRFGGLVWVFCGECASDSL